MLGLVGVYFIFLLLLSPIMLIYHVTVKVNNAVQEDWVRWMVETHIPDVMCTNLFYEYRLSRLLGEDEDDEDTTYSVEYLCRSFEAYQMYQQMYAPALQQEHAVRYAGKFVAFRTLSHVVSHNSPYSS
jgi:hypothetical protein